MNKGTTAGRIHYVYMDILRIFACLCVIYNHTNERGFMRLATDDLGSGAFFLDVTMSTICKVGVPLFFMMSGALLIKKEEEVKRTLLRIPRILIDLIVFTFLYSIVDAKIMGYPFSFESTIQTMVGTNYWHLWYLYAYIVFLISLPVLRKLAAGLDETSSKYLFWLAFFFMGIYPMLEALSPVGINNELKLTWVTANVFIYPMLGYAIEQKIPREFFTKERLVRLWILNIACFVVSEIAEFLLMKSQVGKDMGGYFDERFLISFCVLNAVLIYATVRHLTEKASFSEKAKAVLAEVGKDTFGIYLLHIWFLWKIPALYQIYNKLEHAGVFGYHFGILVSCIIAFICAGIVTSVLRRIPVIKKLF